MNICYHVHHGLTQEKLGSEEVRLAPLAPLPASMLQSSVEQFLLRSTEHLLYNSLHNFLVPWTPTRCSVSYRFRGSLGVITPHPISISNYASASPFWKSTGSYRFPNTLNAIFECIDYTMPVEVSLS